MSGNPLSSIKNLGGQPATDGIANDSEGNFYFGAYKQQAFVKWKPDTQ